MSFEEEYTCPNCNAILNNQPGFDPESGVWTCTECGQTLYGDDVESSMDRFDGVVWFCDSCGAVLNKQFGFNDYCGTWYCSNCGHANAINENEVYNFDEDYGKRKTVYECPNCGSTLNDQWGFSEDDYWTCSSCNTRLEKEYNTYSMIDSDSYSEGDDGEDSSSDSKYSYSTYVYSRNYKKSHWKLKLFLTLAIVFSVVIGTGYYEYTKLIPVQYSTSALIGKESEAVVEELKDAGFTNVTVNRVSDLQIQNRSAENLVTEVKIGWITSFVDTSIIPSNFPVVVTVHTLKQIPVPMSSKDTKGKHYLEIKQAFENAGFVNIEVEAKYDITTGWLTDDGEVESVRIGKTKQFSSNSTFRPDETIVITYHTLRKNKPN